MLINILETAFNLIISLNKDLFEIISLSLKVTISALIIAVSISIPIGAFLALYKKKFHLFYINFNTLMGMPLCTCYIIHCIKKILGLMMIRSA